MRAFHNNQQLQEKFFVRVKNHYDADEIIKGVYWEKGKGCAIGCMVHSSNHIDLERIFGIPEWLSLLIDRLFEKMENKYSKEFVMDFTKVVTRHSFLGFDNWQHIYHQICLYILEKICNNIDNPLVSLPISNVITLHRLEETNKEKWAAAYAAATAAEAAAKAAYAAATAAVDIADTAAAYTAVYIATTTASAAYDASAYDATAAANAAAYDDTAYTAATTYKLIANKLLELLDEVN